MNRSRTSVASCVLLLTAAACTTPTPNPPSATIAPITLSVQDVREISRIPDFRSDADWDLAAPSSDPNVPEPCRAIYDDATVFGSTFKQFRSVAYGAVLEQMSIPSVARVTQNVAIYPDPDSAKARIYALEHAVPRCNAAGVELFRPTVKRPDSSTILLDGDGQDSAYRIASSTLFSVSSLGLADDDRVAIQVLNQLQDAQPS